MRAGYSSIAQADALSALAWWQLAGVDSIVADEPHDWLRPATRAPLMPETEPAHAPPPAPPAAALPQSLDDYRSWLAQADLPFPPAGPRVLPAGSLESGIMLLSGQPEIGDRETLFAGGEGRLLEAMLAAVGVSRAAVYLSSLSPVHMPGRPAPAVVEQLAETTRHHLGLATPRVLLLLGDLASQALLGGPVAHMRGRLHEVNHSGGKVTTLSTFHPRLLLSTPARKADAWQDLRLLLRELGR